MRIRTNAMVASAVLLAAGWAWAQTSTPAEAPERQGMHGHMQGSAQGGELAGEMTGECAAMMTERRAMRDAMEAMDVRLDDLVAAMNGATGAEKIEAIAETVTALAKQRREMRVSMQSMQMKMMRHMMRHLRAGVMPDSMESMDGGATVGGSEVPASGHESHH